VPEVAAAPAAAGAGETRTSALPLIAAASDEAGAAGFRKCASCHTVQEGAKPMTGPNLHGAVGRPVASEPTYGKYSENMKAVGGNWTYEKLDDYLENPKRMVPKGTMNFAGLKKADERAAVIKFLASNSPNAPPLPAAEAPAEAAPAEVTPAEAAPAK
jgi:cytochrome c